MKRLTCVFLFYSSFVFSQEEINIIYVDNHATLNQFKTIQSNLDSLVTSDFLMYISDGNESPTLITNKYSYDNNINTTLLTQTDRPSLSEELRQLTTFIGDKLIIGKKVKDGVIINLHFFFDEETFCKYDLHQDFVNKILLIYKLRTQNGINKNCNITYNIFNNTDSECEMPEDKQQITIKPYYNE